uniref:DUF6824 domain-containing protein n=1 Tax=Ditylum brightwellii TaxID=49249 RepID=A0A7S2EI87_9STRA
MNDSTASARHNDSESPELEPSTMSNIPNPLPTDVICGRGGGALRHAGNLTYRNIVALNKGLYTTCKKSDKLKISRSIVAAIRETNGRFLEQDSVTKLWSDIGDKKAVEKTSQALREGQPKLRKKIIELETQGVLPVGGAAAVAPKPEDTPKPQNTKKERKGKRDSFVSLSSTASTIQTSGKDTTWIDVPDAPSSMTGSKGKRSTIENSTDDLPAPTPKQTEKNTQSEHVHNNGELSSSPSGIAAASFATSFIAKSVLTSKASPERKNGGNFDEAHNGNSHSQRLFTTNIPALSNSGITVAAGNLQNEFQNHNDNSDRASISASATTLVTGNINEDSFGCIEPHSLEDVQEECRRKSTQQRHQMQRQIRRHSVNRDLADFHMKYSMDQQEHLPPSDQAPLSPSQPQEEFVPVLRRKSSYTAKLRPSIHFKNPNHDFYLPEECESSCRSIVMDEVSESVKSIDIAENDGETMPSSVSYKRDKEVMIYDASANNSASHGASIDRSYADDDGGTNVIDRRAFFSNVAKARARQRDHIRTSVTCLNDEDDERNDYDDDALALMQASKMLESCHSVSSNISLSQMESVKRSSHTTNRSSLRSSISTISKLDWIGTGKEMDFDLQSIHSGHSIFTRSSSSESSPNQSRRVSHRGSGMSLMSHRGSGFSLMSHRGSGFSSMCQSTRNSFMSEFSLLDENTLGGDEEKGNGSADYELEQLQPLAYNDL